jgi:hypothetical protein
MARFQSCDVLAERVIKQILSNVSTRGYEGTFQAAPGATLAARLLDRRRSRPENLYFLHDCPKFLPRPAH